MHEVLHHMYLHFFSLPLNHILHTDLPRHMYSQAFLEGLDPKPLSQGFMYLASFLIQETSYRRWSQIWTGLFFLVIVTMLVNHFKVIKNI
ncbi:hypothetical protein FKM82_008364 [Ascaphus truei]